MLPDGFWEIPLWRESIKWPLQTLFWGFVSLHSALARAIHLAVWNQVYKVILLFRNFPQTGLSHHRPGPLVLECSTELVFFRKVHETSLQWAFQEKTQWKISEEGQQGACCKRDNSRTFAFLASSVEWNNPRVCWCCRQLVLQAWTHHLCSCIAAALGQGQQTSPGHGSTSLRGAVSVSPVSSCLCCLVTL